LACWYILDSNNHLGSTEHHIAFLEEIITAKEREPEESGQAGQGVRMAVAGSLVCLGKAQAI